MRQSRAANVGGHDTRPAAFSTVGQVSRWYGPEPPPVSPSSPPGPSLRLYAPDAPPPAEHFPHTEPPRLYAPPRPDQPDVLRRPHPADHAPPPPAASAPADAAKATRSAGAHDKRQARQADAPRLPYLPGLDGLKAVALLAVLLFSHGLSQFRGGFLAISTAFTLSGFLLAALMLAGSSRPRRLALRNVWERRARRLVPLVYIVVLVVVVLQALLRVGAVPTFRGDVWASLGFVTNWRLAFPGDGFASSFGELSALSHLWPVAVVVQLTILLPLVFVGLMAVAGRHWRATGALFGVLALASFYAAWVTGHDPQTQDLAYYGTHTRAGEVLVGVVLAYALLTPRLRAWLSRPRVTVAARSGGLLALLGLVLLWTLVPIDSAALFRGVTLINALLTAWVIVAVTMPGRTSDTLGRSPLRQLGIIAFAAYLFHWPLFLLLDADRTGLDGAPLFAVRLGASIAAGTLAYWALERPIRWKVPLPRRRLGAALLGSGAVLAGLVLMLPVNPPANISLPIDDGSGPGALDVVLPAGGGTDDAAHVLVVGDQTAGSLVEGFDAWNEQDPDVPLRVSTHVSEDCPLGGPGTVRRFGETEESSLDCEAWRWRLPGMLDAADYDAIVVVMGVADLGARRVDREWRHLGDPAYDHWLREEIDGVADVLSDADAPVMWLTSPHVRLDPFPDDPSTSWAQFDENDPHRVDRLNTLINEAVRGRRGFEVVDLDAWLQGRPGGEVNPDIIDDAVLTADGSGQFVSWLAPQVVTASGIETSSSDSAEDDQAARQD